MRSVFLVISLECLLGSAGAALAQNAVVPALPAGAPTIVDVAPDSLPVADPTRPLTYEMFRTSTVRIPQIVDLDTGTTIYREIPAQDVSGPAIFDPQFWSAGRAMSVGESVNAVTASQNSLTGAKAIQIYDRSRNTWLAGFTMQKFNAVDTSKGWLDDLFSGWSGGNSATFLLAPQTVDVHITSRPLGAAIWARDPQTNALAQLDQRPTERHLLAPRNWISSVVLKMAGYKDCTAPVVTEPNPNFLRVSCDLSPQ